MFKPRLYIGIKLSRQAIRPLLSGAFFKQQGSWLGCLEVRIRKNPVQKM